MAERKKFDNSLSFDLGTSGGGFRNKRYTAQAHNICADGLGIFTDYPLETGMVVRLGLPANGLDTLLPVFAEVAWAIPAGSRSRAGLRFLR